MNPFDLPGPQFLALYWLLGVLTLALLRLAREATEGGDPPQTQLSDPYTIAYLRGGSDDVLRTVVLVLLDRQLLEIRGDLIVARPEAASHAKNNLEHAILTAFRDRRAAGEVLKEPALNALARHHAEPELARLGLVPDDETRSRRLLALGIGLTVLGGGALIKIGLGLSRGRPVSLLVVSAVLFCGAAVWIARPHRTVRGDRYLSDLRQLFDAVRLRAGQLRVHVSTGELALLAAVFGLGAVPTGQYPFASRVVERQTQHSSSGCGSGGSCGSSCGGGCGGGCGGCGG